MGARHDFLHPRNIKYARRPSPIQSNAGEGAILGVCQQTGTSDNLVFYYKRPAPHNDFHATGTIIRAGLEVIKVKESLKRQSP